MNKLWYVGTSDGRDWRTADNPQVREYLRAVDPRTEKPGYLVNRSQVVWWREVPNEGK